MGWAPHALRLTAGCGGVLVPSKVCLLPNWSGKPPPCRSNLSVRPHLVRPCACHPTSALPARSINRVGNISGFPGLHQGQFRPEHTGWASRNPLLEGKFRVAVGPLKARRAGRRLARPGRRRRAAGGPKELLPAPALIGWCRRCNRIRTCFAGLDRKGQRKVSAREFVGLLRHRRRLDYGADGLLEENEIPAGPRRA